MSHAQSTKSEAEKTYWKGDVGHPKTRGNGGGGADGLVHGNPILPELRKFVCGASPENSRGGIIQKSLSQRRKGTLSIVQHRKLGRADYLKRPEQRRSST
jgi:hypothetical protein